MAAPPADAARFRQLVAAQATAGGVVGTRDERRLVEAGIRSYGLGYDEARTVLADEARSRGLRLQSEIDRDVTDYLRAAAGPRRRLSRGRFEQARDLYAARAGGGVPPSEIEPRVKGLTRQEGLRPAPSGWLWRSTRWFRRIPEPAPEAAPMPLPEPAMPPAGAGPRPAAGPSVHGALRQWLDLVTGATPARAGEIAALYEPDAVLLATVSPRILETPQEIRGYFTEFLDKRNLSAEAEHVFVWSSPEAAVASGTYVFRWLDAAGGMRTVPGRFSFVYRRRGNAWGIVHHHSSERPTPAA